MRPFLHQNIAFCMAIAIFGRLLQQPQVKRFMSTGLSDLIEVRS